MGYKSANSTPTPIPHPSVVPFPTSTAPGVPVTPAPTTTATTRKIPLRRSDPAGELGTETAYRLEEEAEVYGDVIAEYLAEDEMMCVQHFDLPASPMACICWIGPLESAGVYGSGLHRMKRITILGGSAEEAALSLMAVWRAELSAAGERESCGPEQMSISYDGGVFRPRP